MSADATSTIPRRRRARLILLGLFAIFLSPILLALGLIIVAPDWLPFGQVNYGELVQPPRPAALHGIEPVDGLPAQDPRPETVWTLVQVSHGPCQSPCLEALVKIRQARLALGKDAGRVGRWWLVTTVPDERTVSVIRQDHPGLRVGRIDPVSVLADAEDGTVQLIDPAGLLILRFSPNNSASEILHDVKRLLKISKQG